MRDVQVDGARVSKAKRLIPHAAFAAMLVGIFVGCSGSSGEESRVVTQHLDSCAHPICATGTALQADCDPCTTTLCAADPYCCSGMWDATCVSEVQSICGLSCTAPPPRPDAGTSTCAHPVCATGGPLASVCEPCATQLCAQDPYCCSVSWDATCVAEVGSICHKDCN